MFDKRSSVINSIYSGQLQFSYIIFKHETWLIMISRTITLQLYFCLRIIEKEEFFLFEKYETRLLGKITLAYFTWDVFRYIYKYETRQKIIARGKHSSLFFSKIYEVCETKLKMSAKEKYFSLFLEASMK
jgi:hypothetical protein